MTDETVFVRTASRCRDCPLRDRNRVWGRGTTRSKIAFVGEAPGETEDRLKTPFVGRAGKQFDKALYVAEIDRRTTWTTNILCCRPPKNDIDSLEALEAMKCCKPGLEQEMEFLARNKIRVLVPLGNTPKKELVPEATSGITKVRGSVYEHEKFFILPTIHPSYFTHTKSFYKKRESTVSTKLIWYEDFRKAKRVAKDDFSIPPERFNLFPDESDLEEFLTLTKQNSESLAVDIETSGGFTPDKCEIFMVGLARNESDAICIPFYKQNNLPYWNGNEDRIRALLDRAFGEFELVFQNALFDVTILRYKGFGVPWENILHDSMLLHHSLDPELPHDIGTIVSLYGLTPYWKDVRIGKIASMPDEEVRTYNLRDCVVLHQIIPPMWKDLSSLGEGPERVYLEESMKLIKPVGKMHLNGIKLHKDRLDKFITQKHRELEDLRRHLKTSANLPQAFNLQSDEDLRYFLFGKTPNKFKKISDLDKKTRTDTKVYKQLSELKTIRDGVLPIYVLGQPGKLPTTDSGLLAVNDSARLSYRIKLQNKLGLVKKRKIVTAAVKEEKKQIMHLLEWLEKFEEFTTLEKILSTYARFPVWADKRIHSRFMIHGTSTGRLASRDPNLQNIPKKFKGVRKCMVTPKNRKIVSADYSNLEVRILAEVTNDDVLRAEVEKNVHDENTKILFGLTPDDPMWGSARRAAKIFFFGTIAYGGGPRKVYKEIVTEVPELRLEYSEYSSARDNWFAAHPTYTSWRTDIERDTSRLTRTFGGRIRQLHGGSKDIFKEKLNTPVQGGAAHIINRSMIRMENILEREFPGTKIILQIHDQLVYEVPTEDIADFVPKLKAVMEEPIKISENPVSFPVDIEIGDNLEELTDYANT